MGSLVSSNEQHVLYLPFEVNWHLYVHTLSKGSNGVGNNLGNISDCSGKDCNLEKVGKILVVDVFTEAGLHKRI